MGSGWGRSDGRWCRTWIPPFHPDQTTLFGVLYTRGLIYEWMVAFEDNATGVPVSPTPRKLFQDRAAAGSWSCVLAATLGWLSAAQFRVTW